VESYREFWYNGYLLLLINLVIATGVFTPVVAWRLAKKGIYQNFRQAARDCAISYVISTAVLLAVSLFINLYHYNHDHPFDVVMLLPSSYTITRLFFPLSLFLNAAGLHKLNSGNVNFRNRRVLGPLLLAEILLLPVDFSFLIFWF
jgi:hypothetical protein